VKDFATLKALDLNLNESFTLEMPTTSNVLQYIAEDGTRISIRPSGTEPKIKFYIEVHSKLASRADYNKVNQEADAKIEQICKDLGI
jgi:phosphoglucomutase